MPIPENENQVDDDENENENRDQMNPSETFTAAGDEAAADGAATEEAETNENPNGNGRLTAAADGVAAVVGGVSGAAVATPWLLVPVGFTQGGVVGGSIAAAWQATIGNVAAGSLFAWCQSVAVVGVGGVVAPAALTAAGAYAVYRNRESLSAIPGRITSAGQSLTSYFRRGGKD